MNQSKLSAPVSVPAWAYARYSSVDGIAVATVMGTLTLLNSVQLRREIWGGLSTEGDVGLLIDLREVALEKGGETSLFHCSPHSFLAGRLFPFAIVVPQALELHAHQWDWEMAHRGVARRAFTSFEDAHAWVLVQHENQRESRTRSREVRALISGRRGLEWRTAKEMHGEER
jgi:hypothetical protein